MKIRIYIPQNNIPERRYVIYTFFGFFSDLEKIDLLFYPNQSEDCTKFIIENKEIIINNALWTKDNDSGLYINSNNVPIPKTTGKFKTLSGEDLIILYGNDNYDISYDNIYCGTDILAGIFFMLSRWEESLPVKKDFHERFPMIFSTAYRFNFTHRPIVNEYVELFKGFIKKLGIDKFPFKHRQFEIIPTHDVDAIFNRCTPKAFFGDILKRHSISGFLERTKTLISDPVMTFDFLMSESEIAGLKSRFYFMAANGEARDPDDYLNTKRFMNLVDNIKSRGHIIGFHPGYNTFLSEKYWNMQYNKLSSKLKFPIKEGRQHYLRWSVDFTQRLWANNNMEIDSSLGFPEEAGFRCGTGDIFPIFDIIQRKQLSINERPLIIMDASYGKYGKYVSSQCEKALYKFKDISIRYNMPMTILFHNSNFTQEWRGMKEVYSNFMRSLND